MAELRAGMAEQCVGKAGAPAPAQPATARAGDEPGCAGRIRCDGVRVRRGEVVVLDGLDLELPLRARSVLIGPNGAGKTTLLQALHGLMPLTAGRVSVESERDVDAGERDGSASRANRRTLQVRFGFVFQKPVMLRRTACENVEHALGLAGVPASGRRARAERALDEVGLGYAAQRPARRLSGGEQQRVAIARANALEPDCLLLDEPTSSLDPAACRVIEQHLLAVAARGRGFLMSTHDLGQARRLAQWVVFMHRGRVLEVSDAATFFTAPRSEGARRFIAGEWLD